MPVYQRKNCKLNPSIPNDIALIKQGKYAYSGSLLLADISGFTELTEKLALHGKKGTENLTEILNGYFRTMYEIVREHGGIIISSAGDSVLVRFPPRKVPDACASRMMSEMENFENLKTDSGMFRLGIKIVLGYGSWTEFIVGNRESARIFLAGDIIEKIAVAEDTAASGETVVVRSETDVFLDDYILPDLKDSSFYIPGTENLQGEHRSITAVFINFSGYDKTIPPHSQIQTLYLEILDIARKYNGIIQMVDNILKGGSRIFLLFGAPRSYGNDLLHAVQASLEINSLLSGQYNFQIRIGIDEGFAFAGLIGNSWSRQYTVIGDVVNTAARLSDSTEPGNIAVTDKVYRMSSYYFEYKVMDSIMLKGKESSIRRFSPVARRVDTYDRYPFVGREKELAKISTIITEGRTVIKIEGEAGIGKTSLLKKLSERLTERGYCVLHGTSPEHGDTNDLFASLIENLSGMLDHDSSETKRKKLRNLIRKLDDSTSSISRREVFLGRMLFSLTYTDSYYDTLPPKLRRENLLDGICEIIGSHRKPLCVILEDVHHSSDEDIKAIEYITRQLLEYKDGNVSFVLSKRPEERKLLEGDEFPVHRMFLEGLGYIATNALMIEILNGLPLEESIENLIRERANGNPFYLMQFLLYLIEEKLIRREGGIWVRTGLYSDDKLPGNVFSMVMARIDRLEKQAKECLRIGSVAGLRFDEEIVRMVLRRDVHDNLMDCTEAGLTYQSELKDLEFVFSHTLIKDVSYDSILRKRRREIHGEIGEILEKLHPDQLDALCSVLAYHFRIAEKWKKALKYSIAAGEKAWSEYRNLNAIQYFKDAVNIIENRLENNLDRHADCCYYLGKINDRMGNYDIALEYYNRALNTTDDLKLKGKISISIANILYTRGEIDRSIEYLDDLEEKLQRSSDSHDILLIRIECFRAWTYCVMGKIEVAMKTALKSVELAENLSNCSEAESAHQRGFSYNTIATVHWADDNYMKAREYYLKALEIALSNNMKREIAITYGNIGLVSEKMGEYNEAIDSFTNQLSVSREIGDKLNTFTAYGHMSMVYSSIGQFNKSLETAEKYNRQAEELPAFHDMLLAQQQLILLHLAMGRSEKARELADTTVELSRKSSHEREEAFLLMLLGLIAMEEGDKKTAEEILRESEKLARKVHARSLLQDVLVILADLYIMTERSDETREIIQEAEDLIGEMGIITGMAKIHYLNGKLHFSLGDFEKGSIEFDKAADIFEKHSMKPALANTLMTYCDMQDLKSNISSEDAEKRNNRMIKALELEKEMGISIRRRSSILQII